MSTHTCATNGCTSLCAGRAVYCLACAAERLRKSKRDWQRDNRPSTCDSNDGRKHNGKHASERGIPRLDRNVINWVPMPQPRDGYCTKCRETRLSAANVGGICDGCRDDAEAEKRRKATETFKVRSAKAGVE